MQLHKVGYSLLVLLFLGAVGCNKSTSSDLAAITAGGNSPTPTPTPAPQTNFKLYVGVQGNDGHSYVQTLTYDSAAHTYAVAVNSKFQVDDGAAISADSLRVTTDMLDGNILLGGGSNTLRVFNTSNNTVSNSITLTGLSDVAGACWLPNGHLLASQYGTGFTQTLKEFDATGAYVRDVVTAANFVVDCKAVSNTTVYLMDYNGNSDSWTEVKKAVFSGSSWSVTDSFDATTLGAGNSRYALVVHSNGKLYLPPQNPETGLVTRQMMSCSQSNLSGTCASVGDDISADTVIPSSGDCSTPQGAVEIPGTNELLVMSNLCATGGALLMRYDLTTGVYTPLTSSSGVLPSNFSGNGVRFMRIR